MAGVAPLPPVGTEAGCRGGRVEWMEAGAVLGPGSYWLCWSSEKACWRLVAPADWDKPKPWTGV